MIKYSFFFALCVTLHLFNLPSVLAETLEAPGHYQLFLSFDPENNQLTGTARISLEPGPRFSLSIAGINVTGTLLKDRSSRGKKLTTINDRLVVPASDASRELYISYTKKVTNSLDNIIGPEGIALVSNWHPVPEVPMRFTLKATLPKNFIAVTEADHFPLQRLNNTVTATFSNPTYSLHFAAGPYVHEKREVREGLSVHSLFFPEEENLAEDYLLAAAEFINRYEKEIGPYPYNHYVIAANRLPTGFGIPGFTLIGQMVLRLPFIKETSLGHEILHSWFGNKVDVDYSDGNWCEGLTSYLADHSYRAERGEGIQDRKEAITHYLSYANPETMIALSEFKSASHNQASARVRRAAGYTRGALLFNELKEKIGAQAFGTAIRLFYKENMGRETSWGDLQKSFEASSERDLHTFFQERLNSLEIPSLKIEGIEVNSIADKPVLSFTLVQKTQTPFSLLIPVLVKTIAGTATVERFIDKAETAITIELNNSPLEIRIDPEYTFLRTLSKPELPAVWENFLGDRDKLIILASEKERDTFGALLQSLAAENLAVKLSTEVTNQELGENSLLFLGTDQPPSLSLFGAPDHSAEGFTLDVRTNPLNPEHVAVLVSSPDKAEADRVARRLSHYGKYSFLYFRHGRNLEKKITPTQSGIRIVLDLLPKGGKTSALSSFDLIIDDLNQSRVIYVGETHTSVADHSLQLRIIEALYARDPDLVIGMEMFPASKQPALDRYLSDNAGIDEKTFLKESEYFKVWRYDYRFFRDIINFARANGLSVRGLNLDKEIVSNVFRSGNTDGLEDAVLHSLPVERNLDMDGYRERLTAMHTIHMQGSHGQGSAGGFLQAQGLWDETMAENIADYLKKHPSKKMVVLAGTQHTRKDSGIPPRVKRRIDINQSSVLNISSSGNQENLAEMADYFFTSNPAELSESPKIGVVLVPAAKDDREYLKISQISPHGKAGEAGLQTGDILKKIDGFLIEEMSDLRIAMIDAKEGDNVNVTILRDTGTAEIEMEVTVELTIPPQSTMMRP
jgi:aminopeptidase N